MWLGCEGKYQVETDLALVNSFYAKFSDYDFSEFENINIVQWNKNRKNVKKEYYVELFFYDGSLHEKPRRGNLKFIDNKPFFTSSEIKTMNEDIFIDFYRFKITDLFCKDNDNIGVTIYPNIRIIKSCFVRNIGYVSLDSCWSYKIIKR